MRKYVRPTLLKHERLPNLTAGDGARVTEPTGVPKGGCFEAGKRKRK